MNNKIITSLILGILISVATLYLAFRNVPFADLVNYLLSINYFWAIPSVLAGLLSFYLRVVRWQIILESARKVSFWNAFHPLMTGFMINCILPGRIGEIARPAILKKNNNIPFTTGLATVAAERVFDVILMIVLFAMLFTSVQIDPDLDLAFGKHHLNRETLEALGWGMLMLCLILISGIIIVSINSTRKVIIYLITGIPSLFFFAGPSFKEKIKEKVCPLLVNIVENIASGFSMVKDPKKISACIGLSFIIWSLAAFSYFLLSLGCPGIDLSYLELFAVMIIVCFFIALPSVPGFWGLWEAGGVFAMALFGISTKDAAGYTLANHAIQMFPVIIIGLISAVLTGVNILQVSNIRGQSAEGMVHVAED